MRIQSRINLDLSQGPPTEQRGVKATEVEIGIEGVTEVEIPGDTTIITIEVAGQDPIGLTSITESIGSMIEMRRILGPREEVGTRIQAEGIGEGLLRNGLLRTSMLSWARLLRRKEEL